MPITWSRGMLVLTLLMPLATASGREHSPRNPSQASTSSATHEVVAETQEGVRLGFRFPAPTIIEDGSQTETWSKILVGGARRAWRNGEFNLPEYSVVLAVPTGTEPRLIIENRTEAPLHFVHPPAMVHVSTEETRRPLRRATEGEIPRTGPRDAAVLEALGWVRHQRLARVKVRPVHFDADLDSWVAVSQIEVRVDFVPVSLSADTVEMDSIPEPRPSSLTPLKILVREDGLYRVTHGDLLAAGADPSGIDPTTFVVTNRDAEIAVEITGGEDGTFDPGDTIRFFGLAPGGDETWDNVYRLTGGYETGLRMPSIDATPAPSDPSPGEFKNTAFQEVDTLYYAGVPETSPTPWLWESLAVVTPGVPSYTDRVFNLSNVSTSTATGRLEVRVQSRREVPGPSPNHHVRIYVNNHLVDDQTWTGLQSVTLAGDVDQSWLVEGANTVRVENPADLGLTVQTEYTDWIRLTYHDRYVAEGDYLEFGSELSGLQRFEVAGFSGPDVVVYDLGNPASPVRLTGVETTPPSCLDCTASFSHTLPATPGRFLALRPGSAKTPLGFVIDQPSELRSQAPTGADLLIVAHDDFLDAVAPLVALRRSQGLRVVAAKLTDVQDEFNGGIAETQGIKNFVQWAFENYDAPAPSYLLLVGDATFDPKNHKGQGDNYLPAKMIYAPGFGYVPSETWYAAVSGEDDIPDLAMGRISARSVSDVETYVDNLLASEDFPEVAALNSGLLYVTDDDDTQFEAVTENLIDRFHPPAMEARRVDLRDYPDTSAGLNAATSQIGADLDQGSLVTIYFGHGGRTGWAQEDLWVLGDVNALQPSGNYSFVLALNCVNALFTNLDNEPHSLGERWSLVGDRGAVANWSPSALGTLFNYQVLADRLYETIFVAKETRTGMAAWRALVDAYVLDNIDILNVRDMVFFGDPSARLPLDSDRDGILETDELESGGNPDDADTDDDGLTDDQEPSWNTDTDGDGATNVADADSDNDGLPDGLESGIVTPPVSTDVASGHFLPDTDPASVTAPLNSDTDGGGAPDGAEDRNANGAVDVGETDPDDPFDDPACATEAPLEIAGVRLRKDGNDLVLEWDDQIPDDPCVLYRVYISVNGDVPTDLTTFVLAGVSTRPTWSHFGGATGLKRYHYLVTATSPNQGDGPLGHYGR